MRIARAAALCALLGGCGGAGDEASLDRNEVARRTGRVEVRPGLWEVTTDILSASEEGLPLEVAERMKGRRTAYRHCITPAQAARPGARFLASGRTDECTYSRLDMREGRIRGAMTCRDAQGVETQAEMEGRYGPQSYDLRMAMRTPGVSPGQMMNLTVRQTARHAGDCPATGERKQ